jgi:hypothetical protein
MGKYAFIDRIFGTDDEEETAANDAFDDEDDAFDEEDEESDDDSDDHDDDDPPVEDEAALARLDKDFRKQRTRIRAMSDLSELRSLRGEHAEALTERLGPMTRLRTQDLIEEIDIRVTDIRASRGPRGS